LPAPRMKQCRESGIGCGELKPVSEFSLDTNTLDGYSAYCKSCLNAYRRSRYTPSLDTRKQEHNRVLAFIRCSKCGEIKVRGDFYSDRRGKFGVRGVCKECHRDLRRKHDQQKRRRNMERQQAKG